METNNNVQSKLKPIVNASDTATVTMLSLALRQRARDVSNITALKSQLIRSGEKVVDDDYNKFWNELEAAGVGKYIVGRRGNPDRFKWNYSLKEIASAAVEDKEVKPPVERRKRAPKGKRGPGRPPGSKNKKRRPGRPPGSKNKAPKNDDLKVRLIAAIEKALG